MSPYQILSYGEYTYISLWSNEFVMVRNAMGLSHNLGMDNMRLFVMSGRLGIVIVGSDIRLELDTGGYL
jgi:hypothetical protein